MSEERINKISRQFLYLTEKKCPCYLPSDLPVALVISMPESMLLLRVLNDLQNLSQC